MSGRSQPASAWEDGVMNDDYDSNALVLGKLFAAMASPLEQAADLFRKAEDLETRMNAELEQARLMFVMADGNLRDAERRYAEAQELADAAHEKLTDAARLQR